MQGVCSSPFSLLSAVTVESLIPVVISKIPHSGRPFTQGLAIAEDVLYESAGLYGKSCLRVIDRSSGALLHQKNLPSTLFAEGIAVFPEQIIQLTWLEHRALVYDRSSLQIESSFAYSGEGWGLCRDGSSLWMSDGSSKLVQRDPSTFHPQKTIHVSLFGKPLTHLNDLECAENVLYANIWGTHSIARIDKSTGEVTGMIDASLLLTPAEKKLLGAEDVLNGIAYRPKTGTFIITGKGWPWLFEVRFEKQ